MMPDPHLDPAVRHDMVLLFDVRDGNPNGDPDGANQPRFDPETGQGLVTDVCIKRKIRNYVQIKTGEATGTGTEIFVTAGKALNAQSRRSYEDLGLDEKAKGKERKAENRVQAQRWMCQTFYDVRMFGAVMSTGTYEAGKVQGPQQFSFGRSIDSIMPTEHGIIRVARTREEDDENNQMGAKWTVPYGLYRMHGYFNPAFAQRTGVSADDLSLLYEAITGMFDIDRSAGRGEMALRGLQVFSHSSPLGDAPATTLLESIKVERQPSAQVPRSFGDYQVTIDHKVRPEAVTLTSIVEG